MKFGWRYPLGLGLVPRLFVPAVLPVFAAGANAAAIVADGGTATSVSTAANGHQIVNIAPTVGAVSHNTYSSFNVSAAVADLNNVGINAGTIVNEVTSTNSSLIQGAINVLGPRANVILANPNGITVDGGSFQNAGHVVLSTGQVSFDDLTLAPDVTQRNVILTTNHGGITIGLGGLSSTLVNLDLIAKQLAVNDPVTNSYTSSSSGIRAIIGSSTATYDTSYSASDNTHDWLSSQMSPGASNPGIAVDITPTGGLTARRVQLIVTDQGADVRGLGPLYANAGDVVVSTNGKVSAADSAITAAHDISISTPGAVSLQGTHLAAANDVSVRVSGITLTDDTTGPSTLTAQDGSVNLTNSGTISNTGSVIQVGEVASNGSATGGTVTLTAGGNITNDSSAANLGILFAANGAMSLTAQGSITNDNARILAGPSERERILVGVATGEGIRGRALHPSEPLPACPALHQPFHVSAAEAAKASRIAQDKRTMRPFDLVIREAARHRGDPLMTITGACSGSKVERARAVEDGAHLVKGADLRFVKVDDQPVRIIHPRCPGDGQIVRVAPVTGSFAVGNAPESARKRIHSIRLGSVRFDSATQLPFTIVNSSSRGSIPYCIQCKHAKLLGSKMEQFFRFEVVAPKVVEMKRRNRSTTPTAFGL
ncbi:filamentous hemagglutinin N-terminal domain-containing protein [Trinickia violacea]|uniref:Filamentous hemagglutinin N-terminal domain-containing protein n=2 Tax=Trinickia violacea TaxID=2571746 RepID=A0A4P8J271_9BURK|nr:filamentous hemagglutinin N-terminal domain-containing protein [Trinickia violacea]